MGSTVLPSILFIVHALILSTESYIVQDSDGYCLKLELTSEITVSYNSTNGTQVVSKEALIKVVDDDDDVEGECVREATPNHGEPTVKITLVLPDKSSLVATFVKETRDDGFYTVLDNLVYSYDTRNNIYYVDPTPNGEFTHTLSDMNVSLSSSNTFYSCNQENVISLASNVVLKISSIKVQVFDFIGEDYSVNGTDCAEEPKSTTVAPAPTTDITTTTEEPVTSTTTTEEPVTSTTTTEEPVTSTTTTEEPSTSTTTTEEPSTSTTTTEEPVTSTTTTEEPVPSTTTTEEPVPSTTTTEEPSTSTTTTEVPITTLSPLPEASFYVEDPATGYVCLLLNFTADFRIVYNTTDKKTDTAVVKFNPTGTQISGLCTNETQQISLKWRPTTMTADNSTHWLTSFTFKKYKALANAKLRTNSSESYGVSQIELTYVLESATFPKTASTGIVTVINSVEENAFKTPVDKAYQCKANKTVNLQDTNVKMVTQNFEVQAFRQSKTRSFDSGESSCAEDMKPGSELVPVIVGILLTLLIVAVLVAYFIGRRRQRNQNPYEQF